MACVRSGQAAAWPLVSDRSVRRGSRVKGRREKKFRSLNVFSVWAVLEAGGAGTYTSQAIPGSEPGPFSLHISGIVADKSRRLVPARSADAPNAALPRKALAAQAGRGLKHRGRPEPLGAGGPGGGSPPGREAFAFGSELLLRRSVCAAVWPTWTRHPLAGPGSDQEDSTEPGLPAASWCQWLTGRARRGRLGSHQIPRGVAGAPAAPPPAAPDRAGPWVHVRIGTVAAARAGRGLRRAAIGTGPRRPANSSHGNLLVVTGSHVGNRHYLEGIRPLLT
jgi:hypothetical protein